MINFEFKVVEINITYSEFYKLLKILGRKKIEIPHKSNKLY